MHEHVWYVNGRACEARALFVRKDHAFSASLFASSDYQETVVGDGRRFDDLCGSQL